MGNSIVDIASMGAVLSPERKKKEPAFILPESDLSIWRVKIDRSDENGKHMIFAKMAKQYKRNINIVKGGYRRAIAKWG